MRIFLLLIVLISLLQSGCSSNLEGKIYSNISEIQSVIYKGENEKIVSTMLIGMREKEYEKNGYTTELIPFCILVFESKEKSELDAQECKLYVGEKEYIGTLTKNPYDGSLVVDYGDIDLEGKKDLVVTIILTSGDENILLKSEEDNFRVTHEDIVSTIAKSYAKEVSGFFEKKVNSEVYIKIMSDNKISKDYFWSVGIRGENGDSVNMIFSATTGELISKQSAN